MLLAFIKNIRNDKFSQRFKINMKNLINNYHNFICMNYQQRNLIKSSLDASKTCKQFILQLFFNFKLPNLLNVKIFYLMKIKFSFNQHCYSQPFNQCFQLSIKSKKRNELNKIKYAINLNSQHIKKNQMMSIRHKN